MKRPSPNSRTRAVTVMEVCIVLLIVAVLSLLLFPFIKGSTEKSRAISCTQNLRQIGVMLHGLIAEQNGKLRLFRDGNIETRLMWYLQLKAFSGLSESAAQKVFGCPSMPLTEVGTWYCYGLRTSGSPGRRETVTDASKKTAGIYTLPVAAVQEPAKYLMMADTIGSTGKQTFRIVPPGFYSNSGIHTRHTGKANVLFLDGHVEPLAAAELSQYGISEVYDSERNPVKTKAP